MEPSIPLHTLVKLVDAEYIRKKKVRTFDLSVEINDVTSKVKSRNLSSEYYDSKPGVLSTQSNDPNNKSEPQIRKCCKCFYRANDSVSNCLRKRREDEERKRN